jgi:hypothetical protein
MAHSRSILGVLPAFLAAVAVASASSNPAQAGDPCAKGDLNQAEVGHRTLSLMWTGTIENGMHEKIEAEFDKAKDRIKRVDLYLNSCRGSIREMKATIASLRHIKETHRLETEVGWAHECASACVPIFLQGQSRYGALTSSWLFHEAGRGELEPVGRPPDKVTVERELTERLFNDYKEMARSPARPHQRPRLFSDRGRPRERRKPYHHQSARQHCTA